MSSFFFLAKNDVKLPVILFMDVHKMHFHNKIKKNYKSLQTILTILYPNAVHNLQNCADADFRQLKTNR